jgi:DNA polymerase (family X)
MPLDASAVAKLAARIRPAHGPARGQSLSRAGENLMVLTVPLEVVVAQDRLKEIPDVGDAIADIVTKLHQKGGHPALDAMRKEIPAGALMFPLD